MTRKMKNQKPHVLLPRSIKRLFPKVTHAVDSDRPMHVSVNKKDCADAVRRSPENCALARATKREHHADGAVIGISTSYIIKGKTATRFATPESVQREIVSFDRHNDFATGDYILPPKSPSGRFGRSNTPTTNHGSGGKHAKRAVHRSVRVRVLPRGATY